MLTFEKVITPAVNVKENFLANQPDNSLYQHYVSQKHTPWQVKAQITLADYDNLSWSDPPEVCMTPREVKRIGVKTFPQLGAVGFYRLLYRDSSRVVVPLHQKKDKSEEPVLALSVNETAKTISYVITPPDEKKAVYECYRIELMQDEQTFSHIVYELTGEFAMPESAGEFRCIAIGYMQEGQICSKDSNVVPLNLPGNALDAGKKYATRNEVMKAIQDGKLTVDTEVTAMSQNPVTSAAIYKALLNSGSSSGGGSSSAMLEFSYSSASDSTNNEVSISKTATISSTPGDWMIAIVCARSDINIPDGWTLLYASEDKWSNDCSQRVSYFYKQSTAGLETVTVSQKNSGRMWLTVIGFHGNLKGFMHEDSYPLISNEETISVARPSYSNLIWITNCTYWGSATGITETGHEITQIASGVRWGIFLDSVKNGNLSFTMCAHEKGCWIDYIRIV